MLLCAVLPFLPEGRWAPVEPEKAEGFPFCWQSQEFPNIQLFAFDHQPFGKPWAIDLKRVDGRYRDTQDSYPLRVKLRLYPQGTNPIAHELVWILDSGKFFELTQTDLKGHLRWIGTFHDGKAGWAALLVKALHEAPIEIVIQTKPPAVPKVRVPLAEAAVPKLKAKAKTTMAVGSSGPAGRNENRSNEERMDESIAIVQGLVAGFKQTHDWDRLNSRRRIELLQAATKSQLGTKISTHTLYQEWIKPLWQPVHNANKTRKPQRD